MSRRNRIVQLLSDENRPMTAGEISRTLGIPEATVSRDLGHIARSLRARGQTLVARPAECMGCGFTFDPCKSKSPGKCPTCRSTRISAPAFMIASS